MGDDRQTEEAAIGATIGAGLFALGLYAIYRKYFRSTPPPPPIPADPNIPPGVLGYGFAWQQNAPQITPQIRAITANDPVGLYVLVSGAAMEDPTIAFENPQDAIGIIFPLEPVSAAFRQTMLQVTTDENLLQRVEGFLRYSYNCLLYINATVPGRGLLGGLSTAPRKTYITPSAFSNQTRGNSLCFAANAVLELGLTLTAADRQQLLATLAHASGAQDHAAFVWLANQINQTALGSMYVPSNAYTPAFLNTNLVPVTAAELTEWFANGAQSAFARNWAAKPRIDGVDLLSFVKNATVTALLAASPPGDPKDSVVGFDVRDWSQNTVGNPQEANGPNDRPPAIGLAHELIHAMYNGGGRQPGRDAGHYSTTLTEMLCVGMGPWQATPITENAIRLAWPPPANVFNPAQDPLNLRPVAQRTIYFPPGNLTLAQLRAGSAPI